MLKFWRQNRITILILSLSWFLIAFAFFVTKEVNAQYYLPVNSSWSDSCRITLTPEPTGFYQYSKISTTTGIHFYQAYPSRVGLQGCDYFLQLTDQKTWDNSTSTQVVITYDYTNSSGSCQLSFSTGTTSPSAMQGIEEFRQISNGLTTANNGIDKTWSFTLDTLANRPGVWVGLTPRSGQSCSNAVFFIKSVTIGGVEQLNIQQVSTSTAGVDVYPLLAYNSSMPKVESVTCVDGDCVFSYASTTELYLTPELFFVMMLVAVGSMTLAAFVTYRLV